jgi:hypothetical protein
MITLLPQKFSIQPIIDQVSNLDTFKRLELSRPSGDFFSDPWETNTEYKNTPLGNVIDSLGQIGQARLLSLDSGESYTAHCDPDDRIHLAIITNPYSFLVDITNQRLYHLPADGHLWHMDTSRTHVASNWGSRNRIHLTVRKLLPKYRFDKKGLHLKILEGEYDWKQVAYTPIMKIINQSIKQGTITGFKAINEKEVLVNTEFQDMFDLVFEKIKNSGTLIEKNVL